MTGDFGAAVARLRAAMRDPYDRIADLAADMQDDYREKLDRWERQRPQREMALRAHQRAMLQRHRELGLTAGQPAPIFAAAWAEPPERPAFVPHPRFT